MPPDTTTNPADDSISALGAPVPIKSIEASLKALWSANATHTRCSLINFVVYSERENSLARNAALLADITSDHACRALVIDAQTASGASATPVKSWITAHCHLNQAGGKAMCSEQIAFQLRGNLTKLVPNTVFAHLDSDLPLAFWWQGDFSAAFDSHLTRRIDRLVIDSASWSDPQREFATLQAARQQSGASFIVLDLVSTRLFAHRLALAACFDTPETLAGLDRIDRVTIKHHAGQRFTAQTFAAWMTLKAGWNLELSCTGDSLELTKPDGQELQLDFLESDEVTHCPGVSGVTLSGTDIDVSLAIDDSGRYLQSKVTIGDRSPLACLTPLLARGEASLVSQRLRQPGNDALYFRIWNLLLPCI
jgi:glucose-6-phosphate dehydrogenase assembly protein OpcA